MGSLNIVGMLFSKSCQTIVIPLHKQEDAKSPCHPIVDEEKHGIVEHEDPKCKEPSPLESSKHTPCTSTKASLPLSTSNEINVGTKKETQEQEDETINCNGDTNDDNKPTSRISTLDFVVADFNDPPEKLQLYLKETWASEEILNISIALAAMEAEEQRRIKVQTLRNS